MWKDKNKRYGFHLMILVACLVLAGNAFVSDAKAQSCVTPPPGLVSWWPGDGNADDIIGGNHGTLNGATFAAGMVGQAFSFDGVDDYVDLPEMILSGPFTIEMWWSTQSDSRHTLIGWGSHPDRDYLQFRNNIRYKYRFGNQETRVLLDYVSDGTFYHVALTRDIDNVVRLYHNGNLQDIISNNAADFRISNIGRNDDDWNIMNGLIDEVGIYNRALSASEIWDIYNAGSAGKCKLTVEDMIMLLAQEVMNLNLHEGISNSLDAKLDAVLQALDDANENNDVAAINALEAFINSVEAQRGNKITDADADYLIAAAQEIINLLTGP